MGGAIVTGLMYVVSAYSSSIYIIMVSYGIVGGISTGCTYIASLIIIADYFDKLKGVTTGITMSGSGFGAFAFAPISQILISNFDWQTTLVVLASVILQCNLFTYEKCIIIKSNNIKYIRLCNGCFIKTCANSSKTSVNT